MNTPNSNIPKIKKIIKKPVVAPPSTPTASTVTTIGSETKKTRSLVACNPCRESKSHIKCTGFPCTQCVKHDRTCVKVEYTPSPSCFKKGTGSGETNINALLKAESVLAIRTAYMNTLERGEPKKMAETYNVSLATIRSIIAGRCWKDPKFFPDGWKH